MRAIDGEGGKKRDLQSWYLYRPGLERENLEAWEKRMQENRLRETRDSNDTNEIENKEQN